MARRRKNVKRPFGVTLVSIAALLLASAFLRVALAANQAIASQPEQHAQSDITQQCDVEDTPKALLDALLTREAKVEAAEKKIEKRLTALRRADAQVTDKLVELEHAEKKLKELVTLSEAAAENDLSQLTSVYENMKPKAAAAVFEKMDSRFAAGFLGRMKPDSAAAVMASLSADKAYEVSFILAGRNVQAPVE